MSFFGSFGGGKKEKPKTGSQEGPKISLPMSNPEPKHISFGKNFDNSSSHDSDVYEQSHAWQISLHNALLKDFDRKDSTGKKEMLKQLTNSITEDHSIIKVDEIEKGLRSLVEMIEAIDPTKEDAVPQLAVAKDNAEAFLKKYFG